MDMKRNYEYESYKIGELPKDDLSKPYKYPSSNELETEIPFETLGIYQGVTDDLHVEGIDELTLRTADAMKIDKNKPWREIVRRKIQNG
ncbi:hypothetical protein [Acetobacterium carbinolicum]|uniref:hypothetical protein n=1 Tax=Acetobacterium carbinolicum TaxID=52690 RepID=UPI0039C8D5EF